ncbi:hypothetical protein Tco_1461828, partial [Tanacetum coccineum]
SKSWFKPKKLLFLDKTAHVMLLE